MQTIGALLGSEVNYNPVEAKEFPLNSNIGIELELEGAEEWPTISGWRAIPDGSLRNGTEYVFNGPQGGDKALKTILAMEKNFKKNPPAPTFRCSTHIHLDVRDLTIAQLQRLVVAYCIFEDVMFDHCDPYRRFSNFCTPYFTNDHYVRRVQSCLFTAGDKDGIVLRRTGEFPKYSSLNLQPVGTFGSVEFRGSHAITSGEGLIQLAQRMMHLKRLALGDFGGTMTEYIGALNKMTPAEAFPTGLRDGYVRDFKVADVCYSNALFATSVAPPRAERQLGEPRPDLGHFQAAPRMPNADDVAVALNLDTFEQYGIALPVRHDVRSVLQIIGAFQRIIGVQRPTLRMFVPNILEVVDVDRLRESFSRANLPFNNRIHGF